VLASLLVSLFASPPCLPVRMIFDLIYKKKKKNIKAAVAPAEAGGIGSTLPVVHVVRCL
jgi:hypothetical protein